MIAAGELGVTEFPGKRHNPRILEYHATTTLGDWGRSRDETPWCSSFINWVNVQAGIEGTSNALARSWLRWGVRSEVTIAGDIAVIKRIRAGRDARTGSRGGYHVGIILRERRRSVQLLSGNVSNRVGVDWFSLRKWDVIDIRRPIRIMMGHR